MSYNIPEIPKEKLRFVKRDEKVYDEKIDSKPVGYLEDALIRFKKNKGSVVAFYIIVFLLLFAIFGPIISKFSIGQSDMLYKNMIAKNSLFASLGIWNGNQKTTVKQAIYDMYSGIPGALVDTISVDEVSDHFSKSVDYKIVLDTYAAVGFVGYNMPMAQINKIKAYEKENNVQVLYPLIDEEKVAAVGRQNDQNLWYVTDAKGIAKRDANGELVPNFLADTTGEYADGYARYIKRGNDNYRVRVLYKEYYKYNNGFYPEFWFGTDSYGYDIFTRLSGGARLSFILCISVSIINILIGVIYGAISGYYGGTLDLIMERITDILSGMPIIVLAVLFNIHLASKVGAVGAIIFAFILTGWIGVAARTRTQFYRFKGQEYVLAARTLGAKDSRLIFKHILPNSIGTLITSTILMIPDVVLGESTLSYLGLVDLNTRTTTSVGSLLSTGQSVMADYPHIIFFPALFISLLMISFNIFGNGLRDAFNPSLRGAE